MTEGNRPTLEELKKKFFEEFDKTKKVITEAENLAKRGETDKAQGKVKKHLDKKSEK